MTPRSTVATEILLAVTSAAAAIAFGAYLGPVVAQAFQVVFWILLTAASLAALAVTFRPSRSG